jgi:hypothetical protein
MPARQTIFTEVGGIERACNIDIESGASPKVAQRQLRHSDARITLGIYGHLVEGTHREAVEKLASFLVPNGPNEEDVPLRIQ